MFADNDQFVILVPEKAVNGIAFVQACQVKDQINVQLGLEEKNGSRLDEPLLSYYSGCQRILICEEDVRMRQRRFLEVKS